MNMQPTSTLSAFLAGVVISRENTVTEHSVFGQFETCDANRRCSASPIWMSLTNQMRVSWRSATSTFIPTSNCKTMLCGMFPSLECSTNCRHRFFSRNWCHQLSLAFRLSRQCCNLRSNVCTFRRVIGAITKLSCARITAKFQAPTRVFLIALLACSHA